MGSNAEINKKVEEFKNGLITKNECLEFLVEAFGPRYWKTLQKFHESVVTDDMGSIKNVFLDTLGYSLDKFDKGIHDGVGENKLSFVPFFNQMFHFKTITFYKKYRQTLAEAENNLSIENAKNELILMPPKEQDAVKRHLSFDHAFTEHKDLEEFLKKTLSNREYKILYMRLKDRGFNFIGSKMKKPCSGEKIRQEWNTVVDKIHRAFEKKKEEELV